MIRWIKKRVLLAALLLVWLAGQISSVSAREIDQMPDLEPGRKGTLAVTLSYKDKNNRQVSIEGATVTVLKVADLSVQNGGSPTYTLTPEFAKSGLEFDGMTAADSNRAAAVLKEIAEKEQLTAKGKSAVTDSSGRASFDKLEPAMYLVMQTGHASAIPAYTDLEAYLVSVPLGKNENGQASWNYTVDTLPKMEMTGKPELGSIVVTKRVGIYRDKKIALLDAIDEVFYFGIFEDAAGSRRYANYPLQKAHLKNSSVGTAKFQNLPEGTYYIFETDESGNVIRPDERVVESVPPYTCIIEGKETNAVTIDPDKGVLKGEITFNNVFDDLPWGYDIKGEITIRKNVRRDGKAVKVDDTFYAGIFTKEDGEYVLYHVVELKQNGSVPVPVVLSGSASEPTAYWIFETDSEGKRIDKETFGYEVSGEKSVVITLENLYQSVELTNDVIIEEEESEAVPGSGSNSSSVRTGDETPIVRYLILAAAALLLLAVLGITRVKSEQKQK